MLRRTSASVRDVIEEVLLMAAGLVGRVPLPGRARLNQGYTMRGYWCSGCLVIDVDETRERHSCLGKICSGGSVPSPPVTSVCSEKWSGVSVAGVTRLSLLLLAIVLQHTLVHAILWR